MTGGEIAVLVTAITGFVGGIFGAIKAVGSQKVESIGAVVTAYEKIVDSLQEEVNRLQRRVTELEDSEAALRTRLRTLEKQVETPND